ncbi:MAG: polysaccharide deacetylase family protein [Pseudomonadota bacterium]|nr:polysaccharide deacetylase family protein [Pseudomonadota bacterium]
MNVNARCTLAAALLLAAAAPIDGVAADACRGTIYLTFDTGSQSQAEFIAATLKKHHVKATFFMANEKTTRGDYSLDASWGPYWKARVAEGHAFGTHTFDHVYYQGDAAHGKIAVKPQFGAHAGQPLAWTPAEYCGELKRVGQRFHDLTGGALDPIWRAPGGKVSPRTLAAAKACGYTHFGWAPAGFSGDETSSAAFPNALLLQRALARLKDGDIFLAHLGIWSRKDPWAPADLEPLIVGLQQKGMCFATLREHPDFPKAP